MNIIPDINDIYCCKCGKFILTEQHDEKSYSGLRCIKGSYDDGYYDGIEDQFYCRECAKKYGKE